MNAVYALCVFFFIKILFDIIRYYSTVFKTQQQINKLTIEKLNIEKDFLKSQLNPHFLFNTLNNLYGLSLNGDEFVPEAITRLSQLMRYTLYESNVEKVLLSKEIDFLKNYVELERIRYKNNKRISFSAEETYISNRKIAPLLTFAFVENAFKYGLKSFPNAFVKISLSVADDVFYFSVVNDKNTDAPNREENKYGGIGISNTKKRLELLYPGKHSLEIEEDADSFGVYLQVRIS